MTLAEAEKKIGKKVVHETFWRKRVGVIKRINLLGAVDVKFPDERWSISIHPSELK